MALNGADGAGATAGTCPSPHPPVVHPARHRACLCFTIGRGFAAAAEPLLQRVAPRNARIGGVICPATGRTRDMLRNPIVDRFQRSGPIPGSTEGSKLERSTATAAGSQH